MTFKYKDLVTTKPKEDFRYSDLPVEPNVPTEPQGIAEIENEQKRAGDIVDLSDMTGVDLFTAIEIYPSLEPMLDAVPDPKDITVESFETPAEKAPMQFERAEPKRGIFETFFGFKYPPKPPGWERASLIEKFNFITLPISDVLGRIGGKIATDWRLTTKEKVQTTLAHEISRRLGMVQKVTGSYRLDGRKGCRVSFTQRHI